MDSSGEIRKIPENEPFQEEPNDLFPPLTVLLFLGLTIAVFAMVGSLLNLLLSDLTGFDLSEWMTTDASDSMTSSERQWLRISMAISHIFTFILPTTTLAYLTYRFSRQRILDFEIKPDGKMVGLGILFLYASMPIAQFLYWLNKQLPLPEWATHLEQGTSTLIQYLLTMESAVEVLFALLVVAVLPAIGEELVFRGFLQKQLYKIIPSPHLAILVAALLFSLFHFQFEGFLARAFLGGCLGYLYFWSGSLWLPMIAHFFHNAVQVLAFLCIGDKAEQWKSLTEVNAPNGYLVFGAVLAVFGLAVLLQRQRVSFSKQPE